MKLYVGITDADWFRYLSERNAEEMNFWRPSTTSQFKILEPNELFLFKSKHPENKIVGGAFFARHTTLPFDLAWKAFDDANGMPDIQRFRNKIQLLRRDQECNPIIDCTILTQPFYLSRDNFIDPPTDWPSIIVTGKSHEIAPGSEGLRLFEQAQRAFALLPDLQEASREDAMVDRYGKDLLVRPRVRRSGSSRRRWRAGVRAPGAGRRRPRCRGKSRSASSSLRGSSASSCNRWASCGIGRLRGVPEHLSGIAGGSGALGTAQSR